MACIGRVCRNVLFGGVTTMAFKDFLFHITSYPEPSHEGIIEGAVEFASVLNAQITALTFEYDIYVPSSAIGGMIINVGGMIAAERKKSLANAKAVIEVFNAAAIKHGLTHHHILERSAAGLIPDAITDHARLYDLTIIPASDEVDFGQYIAEKVIFGSGRPVVILPQPSPNTTEKPRALSLERIGIAWDSSRPAARAIADALPILREAKVVRVVTVTNEKAITTSRSEADLARHLALHGIEIVHDIENAAGRSIGETLEQYAQTQNLDMLVMGAYGHWRMRDFFLGGATKSIIANPTLPIFLSH
jgi:nucleotide-binding universal stress UspA family protein